RRAQRRDEQSARQAQREDRQGPLCRDRRRAGEAAAGRREVLQGEVSPRPGRRSSPFRAPSAISTGSARAAPRSRARHRTALQQEALMRRTILALARAALATSLAADEKKAPVASVRLAGDLSGLSETTVNNKTTSSATLTTAGELKVEVRSTASLSGLF